MPTARFTRPLALAYLLVFCVVAAALLLVGAALDALPLVPASVAARYDGAFLALADRLARPADAVA